ncbi:MAG: hypothetical protein M0Z93_07345 [Actinomycetota bacterium]|jgi:hypothetical protein|nr:hypothetical protein [Actinomycetota bacterium]
MGLTPMSLFLACALVVRNLAVAGAFVQARDVERIGAPERRRLSVCESESSAIDLSNRRARMTAARNVKWSPRRT